MAALALAVLTAMLPVAGLLDMCAQPGTHDSGLFEWQPTLACVTTGPRLQFQRPCLPREAAEYGHAIERARLQSGPVLAADSAPLWVEAGYVLRV